LIPFTSLLPSEFRCPTKTLLIAFSQFNTWG
jgi:hypothetical protein